MAAPKVRVAAGFLVLSCVVVLAIFLHRLVPTSASAQLLADLKAAPKGFVLDQENEGVALQAALGRVKADASQVICGSNPCDQSSLRLLAVGSRYVLLEQTHSAGAIDLVLAADSLELSQLDDGWMIETMEGIVYVGDTVISYYKLDTPASVTLPGSQLAAGETYNSGGDMPAVTPVETLTGTTLTISVFDSHQIVSGMDTPNFKYKHLRDLEFPLP